MPGFCYLPISRTSGETPVFGARPQISAMRHSASMRLAAGNQQMQRVLSQAGQKGTSHGGSGRPVQRQPASPQKQPPSPAQGAQVQLQKVTIPEHIRAYTTPPEMKADRIIPGKETWVDVKLDGTPDPAAPVVFTIAGQSKKSGSATIDGKDKVEISQSGNVTLKLKGVEQTADSSNAGHLQLIATQHGKSLASSSGFSVSAIPQNMSFKFLKLMKGHFRGIRVSYNWDSDSDNKSHLDKAFISERVQHHGTGSLKRIAIESSCYGPANKRAEDKHAITIAGLKGPGKDLVHQTFMFKDDRTGAFNIPMKRSGYHVIHDVSLKDDKSGLQVTTTKEGADTTAKDPNEKCKSGPISSKAGDGSMTPQVQDV